MITAIIAGVFGMLTGLYFAILSGKISAKAKAKEEADIRVAVAEKTADAETEVLTKANNVQTQTIKTGDSAIADGLRDKYTRD